MGRGVTLSLIKLLHTLVWTFFVACIVALPFATASGRLEWALALALVVLGETLVLALNAGRCPMTGWAARYTEDRRANFDIYLPEWLARHNKWIFGGLYCAGVVHLVVCWLAR